MRLTARGGHLLPAGRITPELGATGSARPRPPLSPDPVLVVAGALLGLVAGGLAGLLGIGGGVLLVPALGWLFETRLGLPHDTAIKAAVATSLAVIGCTSVSSMRAHHRRGAVHWRAVAQLLPGIATGALLAAAVASRLPADALVVAFAAFVLFSASRLWRGSAPAAATGHGPWPTTGWPERLAAGGVIGSAAALVGAGGAFVSVPYLRWRGLPIHRAIGTSAAIGLPVAVSGALAYVLAGLASRSPPPATLGFIGFVHGPSLAVVALASMAMAPLGARLAHATDRRRLERGFAVLLATLAGWMLLRTLTR
jgi:uncharacterized membrane protein YfcA